MSRAVFVNSPAPSSTTQRGRLLVAALVLVALVAVVFSEVRRFDFLNIDDDLYVTANTRVGAGITRDGLLWAVRSMDAFNWHPLTWVSHMMDVQIFGMRPGWHHATSVLLHAVNTALLFFFLFAMTGTFWKGLLVAALFGVHPLHVESVAWVAERKDVLSGLAWFATLAAYLWYVRRPSSPRYSGVLCLFGLGLAAKPMVVTLPFVLLLLDFWPLGRLHSPAGGGSRLGARGRRVARILAEKVPLLVLALVAGLVTLKAQQTVILSAETLPYGARLQNALAAYWIYLWRTAWPRDLAFLYPYGISSWGAGGSLAAAGAILGIAAWAWRERCGRPYLLVGWLWYLGTLLPVIGLVQVGVQSLADRYTYLPLLGLFLATAWGAESLLARAPSWRAGAGGAMALAVILLAVVARIQVGYWRDSSTLMERALAVTRDNYVAHINLGIILSQRGDPTRAISHYQEALRISPNQVNALYNLGVDCLSTGRFEEAVRAFEKAAELTPLDIDTRIGLGQALMQTGRNRAAMTHFVRALQLQPGNRTAAFGLAAARALAQKEGESP